MIVCIDGPAGAGKSTVARELARRLGFRLLDTGAMYRAVALAADRRQVDWSDETQIARVAREVRIALPDEGRVLLDGEDVSDMIRTSRITQLTRYAANNAAVRERLVELQREMAGQLDVVAEGRDQGTVVFPHADLKFFVTATPEERARRRQQELQRRGEHRRWEDVLAEQNARDASDAQRPVGPLRQAADAQLILTDDHSPTEVVDRLEAIVRSRMPTSQPRFSGG